MTSNYEMLIQRSNSFQSMSALVVTIITELCQSLTLQGKFALVQKYLEATLHNGFRLNRYPVKAHQVTTGLSRDDLAFCVVDIIHHAETSGAHNAHRNDIAFIRGRKLNFTRPF